jgi:hypothetical protein
VLATLQGRVGQSMATGLNELPSDPKPFSPIETKHNTFDNVSVYSILKGENSAYIDQRGPAHKGSAYTSLLLVILGYSFLFVSRHRAQQKGSADFGDLYFKQRGSMLDDALKGFQRL